MKPKESPYANNRWLKIRNPDYSQIATRQELFNPKQLLYSAAHENDSAAGVCAIGVGMSGSDSRPDAVVCELSDWSTSRIFAEPQFIKIVACE
jgi:hypothetical protein